MIRRRETDLNCIFRNLDLLERGLAREGRRRRRRRVGLDGSGIGRSGVDDLVRERIRLEVFLRRRLHRESVRARKRRVKFDLVKLRFSNFVGCRALFPSGIPRSKERMSQPTVTARLLQALLAVNASQPRLISSLPPALANANPASSRRASVAISESRFVPLSSALHTRRRSTCCGPFERS